MTFDEARRAVYLDFEATASEPDRPALVGVLRPDRAFAQYILDRDLRDAARAHRDCAFVDPRELLDDVASYLRRKQAVWCTWSTFDVSVIRKIAGDTSVLTVFEQHFRNALDVVPGWARTYGVRPQRARFDSANQLHRFFEVAGYRPDWRYSKASPARWIRHVRERMKAAGWRYRKVSQSTRRDWHTLLTYNRHDAVGLRHLVLRASAELEQRAAYLATMYSVRDGSRILRFRIGSPKPSLDAIVRRCGDSEWALITAWNPGLSTFSADTNRVRQAALQAMARERGYEVLPGDGQDPDRTQPPEESLFIIGIGARESRQLARIFGQWAIVVGEVGTKSRLEWCLDPGLDPNILAQLPVAASV